MAVTDDEGITLWNPGTQLSIVGNAILILFPNEEFLLRTARNKQIA